MSLNKYNTIQFINSIPKGIDKKNNKLKKEYEDIKKNLVKSNNHMNNSRIFSMKNKLINTLYLMNNNNNSNRIFPKYDSIIKDKNIINTHSPHSTLHKANSYFDKNKSLLNLVNKKGYNHLNSFRKHNNNQSN